MTDAPQVRVGDIVLYSYQQQSNVTFQYPAIVTSIENDGSVNLTAFFDHHVTTNSYIGHPTCVPYSLEAKGHTWMWPNAVAAARDVVSQEPEKNPVRFGKKGRKK